MKQEYTTHKPLLLFIAVLLLAYSVAHAYTTPEGKTLTQSKPPIAIARDGKAALPIVIAPDASPALAQTATELAGFLERITNAKFAIEKSAVARGITLGTLAQFPDPALKEALAVKDVYDGLEAFAIRSDGGRVRLLGATEQGATHAAFRFLELVGCRWFFPGQAWEIVPRHANLTFDLNETSRPVMLARDIWISRGFRGFEKGDPDAGAAFALWTRGNRMGKSLRVHILHRWHAIPNDFKEEFKAHPEYFALVEGKRTAPQFCVTNPGLQKVVVQSARLHFEKNQDAHMVSLDPADQAGWCTCPQCAALGHHSRQPFYLANVVAKELKQSHPGKFVGLLAYSWHSEAPDFALEPNVYVQLTAGMNASRYTFDELLLQWSKKSPHLGIYEYFSTWDYDQSMFPGGKVADVDGAKTRLNYYVAHNVNSISAESANNFGMGGLGYYVSNRLMWDPSADVGSLKQDFYDKAFGPAAPAMQRYYERLNTANNPLPGKALLRLSLDDLEAATALAPNRPDVQARLDQLKDYLYYNFLGQKVTQSVNVDEEKPNTLAWFKWAYRTRNTYMFHWLSFKSSVGRHAAEELGEPTWFWRNTPQNPWKINEPITPQERAAVMQEMKTELGEVPPVPEVKFGERYVLAATGLKGRAAQRQIFIGKATYLLASRTGEPLRLEMTQRDSGVIERPEARYTLTDETGKVVVSGSLAKGMHQLELKVPRAGLYRFTGESRAGWEINLPAELDSGLVIEQGEQLQQSGVVKPLYFYVPKGTTQFAVYLNNPRAVAKKAWVRGPDNKVALQFPADGRYYTVPVPAGQSGKTWSIGGEAGMRLRYVWVFGVPPVFSSNAESVFVPEELAAKDGLDVLVKPADRLGQ